MKWSFAAIGVFVLGLIGISIILLFQQLTTTNENDYYLLKEITEAAMIDSIDISYYRETGSLKIVKEKFVENFTRRFSESTLFAGSDYTINFYDIMETPPKVTVLVDTNIGQYRIYKDTSDYNIQNVLTGILEYIGENTESNITGSTTVYEAKEVTYTYYSMPARSTNYFVVEPINIPDELDQEHIKNVKIKNMVVDGVVDNAGEILTARLKREVDWARAERNMNTNYYDVIDMSDYIISGYTIDYDNTGFYNCSLTNSSIDYIDCSEYDNWIYWKGTSPDSKLIALRLKITWEYEEYEYSY